MSVELFTTETSATEVRGVSPGRRSWVRFRRHRAAQWGGVLLIVFLFIGLAAPWIAPYDPAAINLRARLQGPSADHWFGTDQLGRDMLSRVMHGARISMLIGIVSVAVAAGIGVPLGAIAGFYRGRVDRVIVAVIDFLLAFPSLLLAILVITIFGPGLTNAMIAIGISQAPLFARLMRGGFIRIREEVYVDAARSYGVSELGIMIRHILPNTIAPLIVQVTLNLAQAILSASYLGFLGLGAQPPTPEWGAMLNDARGYMRSAFHVSIYPGVAIMLTVLAFNLFGDGLRDAIDPRSKK